ncbi:sigma factor-like helix-turn-helix DNA-binding protein [Luteibacter yeojuensis]
MDPITRTYEWLRRQLSTRHTVDAVWAGFLDALDELPAEARVAFLMSDIFEASIDEVAMLLRKDAEACHALVELARAHIQAAGPRRAAE